MDYVTYYPETRELSGYYTGQQPIDGEVFFEIKSPLKISWTSYQMNEALDGIEIAPVKLPPEVPTKIVPQTLTMRQARLALFNVGLLDDVTTTIESLESPMKEIAKIEWEFSGEIWRSKQLVKMMTPLLGFTEDQMDDMFIYASKL